MENTDLSFNNNYFAPPEPVVKPKRVLHAEKRDGAFALLIFASVFAFIDFAVFHGFNFGFTLSFFIMFAVFTAYLWNGKAMPSLFSCLCGLLSLAGSVTFTLSRDIFVNFIMVFLVAALFTVYVFGISGSFRSKEGSVKMLADLLYGTGVSPFSNLAPAVKAVGNTSSKNKNLTYGIIGVALAIPVLLVVIPLLVSGDAAFRGLISAIGENIGEYVGVFVLALIFAPYAFSYAFTRKNALDIKINEGKKRKSLRFVPNAVSVSFLCVISLIYLIYLFSQLAYFFSAFSGILPEGYEYSASVYAREGFFEMFAICVINIAVICAVNIFTKKENAGRHSAALKIVECFISLFSLLILITAMSKMVLNVEIFGLSKYRLLVSLLMVMLAVMILFFVLHIFLPKISYMQPIILICSALFIAFSFADMDNIVAMYNVNAYNSGKLETVDVNYMNDYLSESAVPYIIAVAQGDDKDFAAQAQRNIINKIRFNFDTSLTLTEENTLEYDSKTDFREFNLTVKTASEMLCDYFNSLPEAQRAEYANQINGLPDFSDTNDFSYERKIKLNVEVQCEDVYGIVFEYCVDRKRLGAMQVSPDPQMRYPFGLWEICYPEFNESLFPYPFAPDNGTFGITVGVILENGETVAIENLYEWDAAYDETYYFTLFGSKEDGFFLRPGLPGASDFVCMITSWDHLPEEFFIEPDSIIAGMI